MPRKLTFKRSTGRKRTSGTSKPASKRFAVRRTSRNAYYNSVSKMLKRPEKKYFDGYGTSIEVVGGTNVQKPVYATGPTKTKLALVQCFTPLQFGSAVNQRVGNKVLVTNLSGHIEMDVNIYDLAGRWRFVLVRDKQCNGTAAVWGDVFAPLIGETLGATMQSFRNMDQVDRFDILWDKTYTTPTPPHHEVFPSGSLNLTKSANVKKGLKFNLKLKDSIQFTSQTGQTYAAQKNINYLLFVCGDEQSQNEPAADDTDDTLRRSNFNYTLNWRVKYMDV